jgi:hypothetical protein
MMPSYMESPRPSLTSPQMIWRPRCIMKPVLMPALPVAMIVPPFWSMPVRAPTLPLMTRSPPRRAAPVREPEGPSTTTEPDIMFSPSDQPTRPLIWTSGPSIRPQAYQPGLPSKVMLQRLRIPTPSECLEPGFTMVTLLTPSS